MKIAIYTRVSTDKQTDDSQLNELRDYCKRRNWPNDVEYRDIVSLMSFWIASLAAFCYGHACPVELHT